MTGYVTRRHAVALLAAASCLVAGASAQAQTSIKIGYAISKTGPNTGGASITTLPNYQLWVKEVNAAGGIMLSGKRIPVEIVEYDDRSNSEEAVKAVERLATQDKVDFILSPWGTGLNLAVAPIMNRLGYPHLAVTTNTDRAPELAKRWSNASFWLGLPSDISTSFVDVLTKMKGEGKIGADVAMIGVSDQFGIELSTAARNALKKAGFNLVYDKSYPAGTQDVQPLLKDAMAANPDTFIAFSYPPDTLGVTDTAKVLNFNPKVFFVGVGTAFPVYKQRFGENANGVMGIGGWNADSPALKDYLQAPCGSRRPRARPLGEPDHLCQPAGPAAGDREGRQDRSRRGDQGAPDRNLRHRHRQGEARRRPARRTCGASASGRTASSTASRRSPRKALARSSPPSLPGSRNRCPLRSSC